MTSAESRPTSNTAVSVGPWHEIQIHTVFGASGSTQVWLDGVAVPGLSLNQAFGSAQMGILQIGENSGWAAIRYRVRRCCDRFRIHPGPVRSRPDLNPGADSDRSSDSHSATDQHGDGSSDGDTCSDEYPDGRSHQYADSSSD